MLQTMVDCLSRNPGVLMVTILGALGIVAGIVISATMTVSDAWRKVRQGEEDNALKQSMLDRGMSAEEIATVITATSERGASVSFKAGSAGMRCRS